MAGREKAKVYDYYGFPVWYRFERRKSGEVIIVSIREVVNGRVKTIYEDKPHRIDYSGFSEEVQAGNLQKEIEQSLQNFFDIERAEQMRKNICG